jgi:hypothetical protein
MKLSSASSSSSHLGPNMPLSILIVNQDADSKSTNNCTKRQSIRKRRRLLQM